MNSLYALMLVVNMANGTSQDSVIGAYGSKALCEAQSSQLSSTTYCKPFAPNTPERLKASKNEG